MTRGTGPKLPDSLRTEIFIFYGTLVTFLKFQHGQRVYVRGEFLGWDISKKNGNWISNFIIVIISGHFDWKFKFNNV